jgi:hypothetical protein
LLRYKERKMFRKVMFFSLLLSTIAHAQVSFPPMRVYTGASSTPLGLAFKIRFNSGLACTGPTSGVITCTSTSSGGTVTQIIAGTGLSGGTITTSGTIAIDSTVVTLTGSQVLTNKTLTTPTISTINAASNTAITLTSGAAVSATQFVLNTTNTATSGALLDLQNNGASKIQVDASGNLKFQVATAGITDAGGTHGILMGVNSSGPALYNSPFTPYFDLMSGATLGESNHRFTDVWAQAYNGVVQSPSYNASPAAFDCKGAGETVHYAYTGNSTITMAAGNPGEVCSLVFVHENSSSSYTMTFSGSNLRASGNVTSNTANSVQTVTFRWDSALGTPAWVEIGRATGL